MRASYNYRCHNRCHYRCELHREQASEPVYRGPTVSTVIMNLALTGSCGMHSQRINPDRPEELRLGGQLASAGRHVVQLEHVRGHPEILIFTKRAGVAFRHQACHVVEEFRQRFSHPSHRKHRAAVRRHGVAPAAGARKHFPPLLRLFSGIDARHRRARLRTHHTQWRDQARRARGEHQQHGHVARAIYRRG